MNGLTPKADTGLRHSRRLTVDDYVAGVLAGDRAVLARAITLVESNSRLHEAQSQEVLNRLLPHTGKAKRIGITGVPGVGKSTFIETFGCYLVDGGCRLAVLTIDPSSARSGGSILGDKTRMEKLCVSPNAFIRPSPSGDNLGGVARRTRETMLLCEAAGFDTILVESVGVGQSEMTPQAMVELSSSSGNKDVWLITNTSSSVIDTHLLVIVTGLPGGVTVDAGDDDDRRAILLHVLAGRCAESWPVHLDDSRPDRRIQ